MMADPRWGEALARLPDYLGSHLRVSAAALALGLLVASARALRYATGRYGAAFLGVASIVQTVPGLALLALFYPLLLIVSAWSLQWFGAGFSAFGFLPSVLALALYSMLPVLRNTMTWLRGVDPAVLEASQGVGMTPGQSLTWWNSAGAAGDHGRRATAAMWVRYRDAVDADRPDQSRQLHLHRPADAELVFVLFGCIAGEGGPLAVDQCWRWSTPASASAHACAASRGTAGLALLIAVALVALPGQAKNAYVVGAKTFTKSYVLSSLIAQRLQCCRLVRKTARGARLQCHLRCTSGRRNRRLCRLLRHLVVKPVQAHRYQVAARGRAGRTEGGARASNMGSRCFGGLGFENAYALLMPRRRAEQFGIRSIADLARHSAGAGRLPVIMNSSRCPEWAAVRTAYGLTFRDQRQMQPDFMYAAAGSGEVDVIAGYTSDGLDRKI